MFKSLLALLISFHFHFSIAQELLVVEYALTTKMDFEKSFSSDNGNIIPDFIKDELIKKFEESNSYLLISSSTESTFDWVEKICNSQSSGMFASIELGNAGLIYKNLNNHSFQWETSLSNKNYIVSDSLQNYEWKISNETKEILGYETKKAEATIDSLTSVEAWYAPKLPLKNGPQYFGGLPGLILEINQTKDLKEFGDIVKTYKATSIKTDEKKKITPPKKGKIISHTEYEQLKKENRSKQREMHDEGIDKD